MRWMGIELLKIWWLEIWKVEIVNTISEFSKKVKTRIENTE
jgi:hypothetical protein